MKERLKNNIAILKQHNLTHEPVYHITDGKKHEVELINEIVEDCEEIFNDEEQGLIVRLPCKAGSYIYRVTGDKRKKAPEKCEVVGVWLSEDEKSSRVRLYCLKNKGIWYSTELPLSEFGKTLFVEKKQAEKKLKELKGEE